MLNSSLRRLRDKSELATEYREFMSDYQRLGHMRPAPIAQTHINQQVYLPHHGVIRESSSTTRLRVVFNASSVTSNGTSLNDHLNAGPKLQTDLMSVILQWRRYKYVYSSDIAKMYRQIHIDARDIDYQRILWKSSLSEPLIDYQLLTVTYGMSCAPFLALRILKQLVIDEGQHFPLAVPILSDNIYVDDLLFGADDTIRIRQARDQLNSMLKRGGFVLRKWASNSPSLLEDIEIADHGLATNKPLSEDEQIKILGIGWNPANDVFEFRVSLADNASETKRTILSAIAKFYDPLGWDTPVTITAKIFMQQLWRLKMLAWVSQPPSRWKTFVANRVNDIQTRLPDVEWRHVPTEDNPADCASRGIFGDEIINRELWWHGPPWLLFDSDKWPCNNERLPEEAPLEEKALLEM
ncbi:uncharacterized protein LOC115235262 [Formica exsecta]|uniref:uncharacterized protein LOC115235262 n=1 Tax=Formica exsecta TaxID=72781 RepID=UPI001143CACC|nr:uncharacterized protein LOC115235262 [Formica exsecta]